MVAAPATLEGSRAITESPSQMPGALAAPLPVNSASVPSQRSVLASMKDENQSGDHLILPNSMVTVLWP